MRCLVKLHVFREKRFHVFFAVFAEILEHLYRTEKPNLVNRSITTPILGYQSVSGIQKYKCEMR